MLTCIEVVLLDLLLCILNHLGEDWHVNRLVILPLLHQDGVGAVTKCTPEEVLQGDMETARTWVALTSGTSTELVIDTTAFVALGTKNVKSTSLVHSLTLGGKLLRCLGIISNHRCARARHAACLRGICCIPLGHNVRDGPAATTAVRLIG